MRKQACFFTPGGTGKAVSSLTPSRANPYLLFFITKTMGYLFTSESVSEGHPDKVADQISDAVLDQLLAYDPNSKVACETLVTTGQVVVAGEVKSEAYVDLQDVVRNTIARIGYTKAAYKFEAESCGIFSAIHEQSGDINRGVDRKDTADPMAQGAGDQGMMFGYANNETDNYMPLPLSLAHDIVYVSAEIRREGKVMTYLRPDSKSQVTVEYDDNHVGTPHRHHRRFDATRRIHHCRTSGLAGQMRPSDGGTD